MHQNDDTNRRGVTAIEAWIAQGYLEEGREFIEHPSTDSDFRSRVEYLIKDLIPFALSYCEDSDEAISGHGAPLLSWTRIPYRMTTDAQLLQHKIGRAQALLGDVLEFLGGQPITPRTVLDLLEFCRAASFVEAEYLSIGDDLGPKRAGRAAARKVSKAAQRRWVSRILYALKSLGMKRKEAEAWIVAYVNGIIAGRKFPQGFGRDWFASLLKKETDQNGQEVLIDELRSSYQSAHLSGKEIERLAAEEAVNEPPLPQMPRT